MSLLEDLAQNGLTAEDLEKAASVRLFEKVADDEGINFNDLTDEQVEELFVHFTENILPGMTGEVEEPKQASAPEQEIDLEKAASVMLFQKVAAEEDVDLNALEPEQLEGLYAHFLENVLPGMYEEEEVKQANAVEVEEAQAKLAEMDILGRHMARSFEDEREKLAGPAIDRVKSLVTGKQFRDATSQTLMGAAKGSGAHAGEARKILAARGALGAAGVGGVAAAGLGAKKLLGKKKEGADEKTASAFEKLATDRALEILEANGVQAEPEQEMSLEDAVTARAVEMLTDAGYTFEE